MILEISAVQVNATLKYTLYLEIRRFVWTSVNTRYLMIKMIIINALTPVPQIIHTLTRKQVVVKHTVIQIF